MTHTQGKWYFELDNYGNGGFSEWYEIQTEDDSIGKIYFKEDAEFIVRACNAHDDLLEACKMAHDWLRKNILASNRPAILDKNLIDAIAKATT